MAIRATPKLFQRFNQTTRPLSSPPSTLPILPLNFDHKHDSFHLKPEPDSFSPSMLNLDDTHKLFSTFSTTKLIRSVLNLNMASIDPVVDMGIWVMRSRLLQVPGFRRVILGSVKHSFYEQFVAGKDLKEMSETVEKIYEAGLKGMLNYGLEHAYDNQSCHQNYNTFLNTIESTNLFPPSSVYVVVLPNIHGPTTANFATAWSVIITRFKTSHLRWRSCRSFERDCFQLTHSSKHTFIPQGKMMHGCSI